MKTLLAILVVLYILEIIVAEVHSYRFKKLHREYTKMYRLYSEIYRQIKGEG